MPMIPKLTQKDIQQWTDEKYFQRGDSYFQDHAIYNQHRLGMTIKSKCSGTQAPFYRQEVTFNEKGIQSGKCSCPVGAGGRCKHTIALLLTWLKDSESFQEIEDLETTLGKKSKDELIALIHRFVDTHPDLEDLINFPRVNKDNSVPIDLKAIRRQASYAMKHVRRDRWEGEWADAQEVIHAFRPLISLADDYLARHDPTNAAAIYMIVCEKIIEDEDLLNADEEGELGGAISDYIKNLAQCLSALSDPQIRREIFEKLFDIYQFDILDFGGIGFSDDIPEVFIHQSSPDEKEEIAGWFEEVMRSERIEKKREFVWDQFGKMLIELKKDQLNDKEYLALCRKTGQVHALVEHLLKLNHVDEAVIESCSTSDHELINLADLFTQYGHNLHAEELIKMRVKTTDRGTRLLEWLILHAERKKDYNAAFSFAEQLFWQTPDLQSFETISKYSQKISTWDKLRKSILSTLEDNEEYLLLSRIYLKEENIQLAITSWENFKSKPKSTYQAGVSLQAGGSLQFELAHAAEKTLPHEAIRLYLQIVEFNIGRKNRQAYIEAVGYLKKIKSLYESLGENSGWKTLIGDLRAKYPTLRALQEELNKAGF